MRIGFCGADDNNNINDMILLSQKYPFIEWGILIDPEKTGSYRYPTNNWIFKICNLKKLDLTAHLCGYIVINLLSGDYSFIKT